MTSVHLQGKPFNITVIQVYASTSNTEEAEVEWFYEDLQDLLENKGRVNTITIAPSSMCYVFKKLIINKPAVTFQ